MIVPEEPQKPEPQQAAQDLINYVQRQAQQSHQRRPSPNISRGQSMNNISTLVFFVLILAALPVLYPLFLVKPQLAIPAGMLWIFIDSIICSGLQMAQQWEVGVVFLLGRYARTAGPGLFFIIPVLESVRLVDTRVLTMDIPSQQVITRDNVPVKINGVIFFKVKNAPDALIKVQDYRYAISQYAQTSLRDAIGQMTLDQLLVEREEIGKKIETTVEKDTEGWGLEVTGIRIQDIDMPEELKKMMSRQASAEREKRATITKAEGDREAAVNLAAAAKTMAESPGAMQLRTLQTIDGLGPTASNTVVLPLPLAVYELLDSASAFIKTKTPEKK